MIFNIKNEISETEAAFLTKAGNSTAMGNLGKYYELAAMEKEPHAIGQLQRLCRRM